MMQASFHSTWRLPGALFSIFRRTVAAVLFAGVALAIPARALAAGTIDLAFRGTTMAHLQVTYTPGTPEYTSIRLGHSAGAVVLGTYSGNAALDTTVRVEGLATGASYTFVLQGWDTATETWKTITSRFCKLDKVEGTLLFDESLTDIGTLIVSMTVPAGISCSIEGLANEFPDANRIIVYGNFGVGDPETSQGFMLELYSSHVLQVPASSVVRFHPGAGGSAIVGSHDFTLHVNADDIRLRDCQSVWMESIGAQSAYPEEGDQAGLLVMEKCTIRRPIVPKSEGHEIRFLECGRDSLGIINLTWDAGTIKAEKSELGSIAVSGNAVFDARGSKTSGISVAEQADVSLTDCFMGGGGFIPATEDPGGFKVYLSRCEILGGIGAAYDESIEIRDCVVKEQLSIGAGGKANGRIVVSGNSFLGYTAIQTTLGSSVSSPIAIGPNFYGDRMGPVHTSGPAAGLPPDFLSSRGGKVSGAWTDDGQGGYKKVLDLAPHLTSGRYFQKVKPFPTLWLSNWIAGQHTLTHEPKAASGYRNGLKETLVCLDLVADVETLEGVKLNAMLGSIQKLEPINGPIVIHRDSGLYSPNDNLAGRRTVAFVLPPAEFNSMQVLNLEADMSGVTGYDTSPPLYPVYLGYIEVPNPLSARVSARDRLRILVQPVHLNLWFYPKNTPNGGKFAREIEDIMAAMLPVRRDELDIVAAEPYEFYGAFSLLHSSAMLTALASEMAIQQEMSKITAVETIDYVVAVLPDGSMGDGVTGASFSFARNIIFVEESDPLTMLHEMGHSLGLYTESGGEQYDLFPPQGIEAASMTAFVNDDEASIAGFTRGRRFRHFPAKGSELGPEAVPYADLMSSGAGNKWPIPETLNVFGAYLFHRLYGGPAPEAAATGAAPGVNPDLESPSGSAPNPAVAQITTILLSAVAERSNPSDPTTGRVRADSLRVKNVTGILTQLLALPSIGSGEGLVVTMKKSGKPDLPMTFYPRNPDPNPREEDIFFGTLDLPGGYDRLVVSQLLPPNDILASIPIGTLDVQFVGLAPGATIGADETIRWTIAGTSPAVTGIAAPEDVLQPLQTLLFVRPDGAPGWRLLATCENRDEANLSTESWGDGQILSIRLVTTDGFQLATAEVTGLVVGKRPHRVEIVEPAGDIHVTSGTSLVLSADVWDPDGPPYPDVAWNSSIDGDLGAGATLENVVLSDGDHVVTASARDADALVVTDTVAVRVSAMTTVDFAIAPDALALAGPGFDPTASTVARLQQGQTYGAYLQFQNAGAPSTVTLQLDLLRPGAGAAELLAEHRAALDPLQAVYLSGEFVATESGEFIVSARLTDTEPTDPNAANNARSWTYSTLAAPGQLLLSTDHVDFGALWLGEWRGETVTAANPGGSPLGVVAIGIDGPDAASFEFTTPIAPGAQIASGDGVSITIRALAPSLGDKSATLILETSDPFQPLRTVALNSTIVPAPEAVTLWILY